MKIEERKENYSIIKNSFVNDMKKSIVKKYEGLLMGSIEEKDFWKYCTYEEIKIILSYLIQDILKLNKEEAINYLNYNLLVKYKFKFILREYSLSPYLFLNEYYTHFDKCDSLLKTKGKWSEENIKRKVRELCKKYDLNTEEKILNMFTVEFLKNNKCKGMLYIYEKGELVRCRNLFEILNMVYPGRFKKFQIKHLKRNFWSDRNNVFEAIQYILKMENIEIKNARRELRYSCFHRYKLKGLLAHYNYNYNEILDFLEII